MTSSPVGDGLATTGAPRIRRPRSTTGTRPGTEVSYACRQRQVKFINVDGRDLTDSDDIVISDALLQTLGFRRQVEYR